MGVLCILYILNKLYTPLDFKGQDWNSYQYFLLIILMINFNETEKNPKCYLKNPKQITFMYE